jgi:competence protein ComEC
MSALPQTGFISPLLLPAVALCAGITLAHRIGSSRPLLLVFVGLTALCVLIAIITLLTRRRFVSLIAVAAAFLCTGASLALINDLPRSTSRLSSLYEQGAIAPGDPVEITGVIRGAPEPAPHGFYLTLVAERIKIKEAESVVAGRVQLLAHIPTRETQREYDALELRHGARIRVMVALAREDDFRNPGVRPFTEYLEREGYDAMGTIKSPLLIERLNDESVFLPLAWTYESRARLQKEFNRRFSAETAGVLSAALLGNPHNISAGAAERFRSGGTFHLLVISGLQIAFIAGVAVLIVRRITRRKVLQFMLAVVFLWTYTLAVGAQASVARAALMFTIVGFAPIIARRSDSLNTIAAAAIALLVPSPSQLFDPSFQLTFLSVLSIVCIAVPLLRQMQRVGSWQPSLVTPHPPVCSLWFRKLSEALFWSERAWRAEMVTSHIKYRLFKTPIALTLERWRMQAPLRFALAAVIVSASVQLGLLPLMILYFHRVSVASFVLNIFVGLLMAVLAFAALAAVIVAQLSSNMAAPLVLLAEKMNWLMVHAVDPFSRFGVASLRLPHYSGQSAAIYLLYFALLLLLVVVLSRWDPLRADAAVRDQHRRRALAVTAIAFTVVLVVVILHPFSAERPDGELHVDFLDVGQGDSALLTMPDGSTLLVDGGGRPNIDWNDDQSEHPFERDTRSIGERVVSEYLWSRGLDRVDYVIATHADADHIDGLNDIVRNFKVRSAIVARTPPDDIGFARFAESLKSAGVPIEVIGGGDSLQFGEVSIDTLWPPQTNNIEAPYRNNDGIVLRIRYGPHALLFAADIERESETALCQSGNDLRSDVVKVAHHGSRTSSIQPFIDATRPSIAVISVGRMSIFGHPHKEVVERWRASGARVMTTGEKGTISVVTDGTELKVSTFVP